MRTAKAVTGYWIIHSSMEWSDLLTNCHTVTDDDASLIQVISSACCQTYSENILERWRSAPQTSQSSNSAAVDGRRAASIYYWSIMDVRDMQTRTEHVDQGCVQSTTAHPNAGRWGGKTNERSSMACSRGQSSHETTLRYSRLSQQLLFSITMAKYGLSKKLILGR